MFVLSNFIIALAKIIDIALTLYMWVIVFRAVISWVNADPYNKVVIFLYRITEPVLRQIRRLMPRFFYSTGIDFSPIIVILAIIFLQYFLVETIVGLARRL
jgi:YggT family protein